MVAKDLIPTETVFVNVLWSPGIDPSLAGRYSKPICRTGPPDYIAWWSRILGIHSGLHKRLQLRAPEYTEYSKDDFFVFRTENSGTVVKQIILQSGLMILQQMKEKYQQIVQENLLFSAILCV